MSEKQNDHQPKENLKNDQKLVPSFSTLVLSIGSNAAMAMGLAPNPQTQKVEKDLELARYHIDLLVLLQDKTKNNLEKDEQTFLDHMINDLRYKYIQVK